MAKKMSGPRPAYQEQLTDQLLYTRLSGALLVVGGYLSNTTRGEGNPRLIGNLDDIEVGR